jgi:sugar phosphate isomerase/epimerase
MSSRRQFVRNAGLVTISLGLADLFAAFPAKDGSISKIGIQLYMVRSEMEKDALGTLKQLGKMGYRQIESYAGNKGIFWGKQPGEFKNMAADAGLEIISTHYNDDDIPFNKKAEAAAGIGMKYLICPWKGPQKSIDDFKRIAEEFNKLGKICKDYGLRFGYHPHDYPYKSVDGQIPIDTLLANTDKDLVDFEIDFYYTVTEGKDPMAYLEKYAGRFRLCHLRDVLKQRLPAGTEEESACDLGQGIIDYPTLLKLAADQGMQYYFVEQSRFYKETPLESAKINLNYLKNLRF